MNPNLITSHQLSEHLSLTPATIRKWARQGRLLATKIGDDWRFNSDLTMPVDQNSMDKMGRHKEGYRGPKYLIKKSDSPYWYIKWKDIYKSTETDNLMLAQLRLAEEQQRHWAKQILQNEEPHSINFSNLVTRYLKEVSPTKLSSKSDHTNARKPLEFFGDKSIDTITPQECYRYQEWRKIQYVTPKKEGKEPTKLISGATVNRELALVKRSLKYAVRWGYIVQSPVPEGQVEGMNENKRERYLTDEEYKNIQIYLDRSQSRVVDCLYFSAQRSGRIFALQWKQIDFGNRTIVFNTKSKNKKAAEVVYINGPLLIILKGIYEERKTRAVISPYVFSNRNGSPVGSIKKAWKTACKRAGVENARIHDIRHKAITDMSKAGVPLAKIKKAVGHSQVQTTDGYTHLSVEDVKEAFEALK